MSVLTATLVRATRQHAQAKLNLRAPGCTCSTPDDYAGQQPRYPGAITLERVGHDLHCQLLADYLRPRQTDHHDHHHEHLDPKGWA